MKLFYKSTWLAGLWFLMAGCNNLEDAPPSSRNTYIRLYEGPYSFRAIDLEKINNGYVILGDMTSGDSTQTVLFTIDNNGNQTSEFNFYGGGNAKALKPFNGGYIVIGDSIYADSDPEFVANAEIASARFLAVDQNFNIIGNFYLTDNTASQIKTDYYGGTVTINANGTIIFLCTYKAAVVNQLTEPERPFLIALNPDFSFAWSQPYDLINRNYINSKSIHYNESLNSVVWGSAINQQLGELTRAYVAIPYVQDSTIFTNYSTYGTATDQYFRVNDIQPANTPAFGYGIVGTFGNQNQENKNIFFARVTATGTIVPNSIRYFDGISLAVTDSTTSGIEDTGETLCSTRDGGFVIAGSVLTNPAKGNGNRDIILIKVSAGGNLVFAKDIGGSGDEIVSNIIETDDGGLIISGTNTVGSYGSIFVIKTDANGNLNN
jgi:hypothetical protein